MNERIKPLTTPAPRIHGHVALELRDERGRVKMRTETDNLVTDAVAALMANVAGGTGEVSDYVMPIAMTALGGLFLFDEELESSASKYEFPAGTAKLLGYALQDTNTTNPLRGSLVSSAAIAGGWQTEWEFLPSQACGTIKAAALSNSGTGMFNPSPYSPFAGWGEPYSQDAPHTLLNDGGTLLNDDSRVIYYDQSWGEAYYASSCTVSSNTVTLKIYRERVACGSYKVGDVPDTGETSTLAQTITANVPLVSGDHIDVPWSPYDAADAFAGIDSDGKVWFVFSGSHNANLYPDFYAYVRLAFDSGTRLFSVDGVGRNTISAERPHHGGAVSGGKLYLQTSSTSPQWNAITDRLLVVDLANMADVSSVDLPSGYYFEGASSFRKPQQATIPCGGGLLISVYKSGDKTQYRGTYTPDKGLLIDTESYGIQGGQMNVNAPFFRLPSFVQGWNFPNTVSGAILTNYLGTVANLTTPVIKTAADTLRVVYTLTDI